MIGPTDTLIGTVVDGRFEIRDKLGQGGMGAVYRAWQRSTEREIAVKLIAKSQAGEPMAVERFLREARLASQLSHPNTISVYDFGKLADGRLFIAMELLRGKTLGRILRSEGALSLDRVVRIAIQICDALAAAHALKIVHRDLKPDNVMLIDDTADLIKVLDFGLAKRLDDKTVAGTAAGVVVGTPRYIPPESVMSGSSYPEGDLYALGVMIAEMSLGRALWNGTLAEILRLQVRPAEHIRDVPEPLRAIVASLVDPTPSMRPTAAQLRNQLVALQSGVMPRQRPVSSSPPSALPTTPATVAARPRQRPSARTAKRPRWPLNVGISAAIFLASGAITCVVYNHAGSKPATTVPPPVTHPPVTRPPVTRAPTTTEEDPWHAGTTPAEIVSAPDAGVDTTAGPFVGTATANALKKANPKKPVPTTKPVRPPKGCNDCLERPD